MRSNHNHTPNPHLPFFVYGTLLPGQPNHHLLKPFLTAVQPAQIRGCRLYSLGAYPMLIETKNEAHVVKGALCSVKADRFSLVQKQLDELEGYDPQQPNAPGYRRETRLVQGGNGRFFTALVYLGSEAIVHGAPLIVDGDWANFAQQQREQMELWWRSVDTVAGLFQTPPQNE